MVLRPNVVKQILSGQRTQLRSCKIYKVEPVFPLRCWPVRTAQGEPAACHITVVGAAEQELGEPTLRSVRRECFRTTLDFREDWIERYKEYDPKQRIMIISFQLGDHTDKPRLLAAKPGGPGGDYTHVPALALKGSGEEVSDGTQSAYAANAAETQAITLGEQKQRLQAALAEIRKHGPGASTNAKLRAAERKVRKVRVNIVYDDASTG